MYCNHSSSGVSRARNPDKVLQTGFKFRVLLCLDWLPPQGQRVKSALLVKPQLEENGFMPFPRALV